MTEWERLHRRAQMIKDRYPAGTRVMLLHMGSDPRPIEPNSKGTVVAVDDIGTVHCDFDNGRSLGVIRSENDHRPSQRRRDEPQGSQFGCADRGQAQGEAETGEYSSCIIFIIRKRRFCF